MALNQQDSSQCPATACAVALSKNMKKLWTIKGGHLTEGGEEAGELAMIKRAMKEKKLKQEIKRAKKKEKAKAKAKLAKKVKEWAKEDKFAARFKEMSFCPCSVTPQEWFQHLKSTAVNGSEVPNVVEHYNAKLEYERICEHEV